MLLLCVRHPFCLLWFLLDQVLQLDLHFDEVVELVFVEFNLVCELLYVGVPLHEAQALGLSADLVDDERDVELGNHLQRNSGLCDCGLEVLVVRAFRSHAQLGLVQNRLHQLGHFRRDQLLCGLRVELILLFSV